MIAAWLLILVGIVAIGVVARIPGADHASNEAVVAVPATTPLPTRGATASSPVPTPHHSLGEDGLMGGIVFGDNVPRLTQADIERDGYRYYGQLLVRDAGTGR